MKRALAFAVVLSVLVAGLIASISTASTRTPATRPSGIGQAPAPASPASAASATSAGTAVPGVWEVVWRGTGELSDLQCTSADFCVGVGTGGMVVRTTTSGATWHFDDLASDKDFNALSFGDAQHAVIAGNGGAIYRSADGAATWQAVTPLAATDLNAVSLLADGNIWVAGSAGAIWHSADGGATWTAQTSGLGQNLNAIQFLDATTGFAAGNAGTVLRTINGGATWEPVASGFPSYANINTLFFTSAQQGWIAGQAGLMRRTTDGGATWQPVDSGVGVDIFDLHFAGAFGVLGADRGLVATSTGGSVWTVQTDETAKRSALAVFAVNPSQVWAGGFASRTPAEDPSGTALESWWVYKSEDGGPFKLKAGDFFPQWQEVAYPAPNVAYVAGQQWAVLKTVDGGETWAWLRADPSSGYFASLACPDADHCWGGGRYASVYATSDGGQTWQRQVLPGAGKPVYDMFMWDTQRGLAGTNGFTDSTHIVYRTDNGGQTWVESKTVGRHPASGFSMPTDTTGWVALRNWSYWKTHDGGRNFTRIIDTRLAPHIYVDAGVFDDNGDNEVDQGWLVGCVGPMGAGESCHTPATGVIAHTPDGGVNWDFPKVPAGTKPLIPLKMLDSRHGWAGGDDGTLIYMGEDRNWIKVDSGLPAGNSAIQGLNFADPQHGIAAGDSGYVIRFEAAGRTLDSYPQPGPITVDGQAGDWYVGGELTLDASNANTVLGPDPAPTPADLSASIHSRWTMSSLYLLAEINDDHVTDQDDLQIALDGRNDKLWNGFDDQLITIGADGSVHDSLHPGQQPNLTAKVSLSAIGWTVELVIPAATLGRADFAAADAIGLNLAVTDADTAGHTLLFAGKRIDDNPALFGAIQLLGDTIAYKRGIDDYQGAADVHLERWDDQSGSTPRGGESPLKIINGTDGQVYADAVLRFDLDGLPQGAQVQEATLDLTTTAFRIDQPMAVSAFRLLKPWLESTATWMQPAEGQAWGTAGARQAGVDYDAARLSTVTLQNPVGGHVQWDVTGAVQAWLADPGSNDGVLLLPESGSRYLWAGSSEAENVETRPKLTVRFELQARPTTPTPTPTLTPTATPTPTPTATPTPTSVPARVRGVIYEDANGNGQRDPAEQALAGATLHLTGPGVDQSITTAADGLYSFANLSGGQYTLAETPPPGYGPSTPASPITLGLASGVDMTLEFRHVRLATATPTTTPTATATPREQLYLPLLRR